MPRLWIEKIVPEFPKISFDSLALLVDSNKNLSTHAARGVA